MIFGEGLEEVGKAVTEPTGAEIVVDERTKVPEGEGTVEKTAEEIAAEAELAKAGEKTQEQIDAEKADADALLVKYPGKTPEEIAVLEADEKTKADQLTATETMKQEMRQQFLKDLGVSSEEELKAKLNPAVPESDEQRAQKAEVYNANLAKFAIEQKVFTNNDWLGYHNMMKMPDNDLVFKDFEASYKELNKDRQVDGNPDPVTSEEIKDKFNELYHLDSETKALKDLGEKNIKVRADAIKGPLQQKYDDIKAEFDQDVKERQAIPGFEAMMKDVLQKSIPDKWEFGEGEEKVTFDLTKADKKAIEKSLIDEIGTKEFSEFVKGNGTPEQRERIARAVEKELVFRHYKDVERTAYSVGKDAGKKIGAQGSQQRFTEPSKTILQSKSVEISDADNQKIAQSFASV
jgi:hypothetical protein